MIEFDEQYKYRYPFLMVRMIKVFNKILEEFPHLGAENDTTEFERLLGEMQEIIEYYIVSSTRIREM